MINKVLCSNNDISHCSVIFQSGICFTPMVPILYYTREKFAKKAMAFWIMLVAMYANLSKGKLSLESRLFEKEVSSYKCSGG